MESRVDFVCCDNPHANRLTLHILAAVAEDEARRISERTKAALAAYKARGGRLGTPGNLTPEAGRSGAAATRAKARTAYAAVLPELRAVAGGRSELPADRGPSQRRGRTTQERCSLESQPGSTGAREGRRLILEGHELWTRRS